MIPYDHWVLDNFFPIEMARQLAKEFPDYNFFVDPVAHDGGTAIGAAVWYNEQK